MFNIASDVAASYAVKSSFFLNERVRGYQRKWS